MMKYIQALALIFLFLVTPAMAQAATISVSIPLEQREYPAATEIAIPINITSSDAFNAYTITVEYENLEFVRAAYDQSWTAINGPTQAGNSVTFTAALLGKNKYEKGDVKVITLIMKTPADGNFTLKGMGAVALTDADASQLSKDMDPVSFSVTNDMVKSTMFNIENSQQLIFKIARIAIPILILVITIWLLRMRRRKPGRKPSYQQI